MPALYTYADFNDTTKKIANSTGASTFDILERVPLKAPKPGKAISRNPNTGFSRAGFKIFFLQSILALNVQGKKDWAASPEAVAAFSDGTVLQGILNEHTLVTNALTAWNQQIEPIRKQRKELKKAAKKATA